MKNIKATCTNRKNSWRTMAALMLATILLVGIAATSTAQAQTYTVLYNFGGVPGDPEWFGYSGVIAQGGICSRMSTSPWTEPCWRHGPDRRAFAALMMTSSRPPRERAGAQIQP